MPQPAAQQRHRARAADRQRLAVASRRRAIAVARYSLETVKEGEVPFLLRQGRNEVAERGGDGQADTPYVAIADTEQHGLANQRAMTHAAGTEAQHRLGKDETDIVLQALAQAIAPVGVAVGEARPRANP